MDAQLLNEGAHDRLVLSGDINIYEAQALRQKLMWLLMDQAGREVHLDAAALEEADTSTVQVLWSAAAFLRHLGAQPVFKTASDSAHTVAKTLGMHQAAHWCGWQVKEAA